ncbi:MAG: chemotaxis protein CheA [Oscillospiraceae bacterium]|nr:chemotaxis protein CheA [Oscillospiraceae bacterium]
MSSGNEQMMEMFLFEMSSLLEQLDEVLLTSEKNQTLTEDSVNEVFRIMHTIKGSAAMMELDLIASVTHKLEDSFFHIRDNGIDQGHFTELFDLMLDATDFLKGQLQAIQDGEELATDSDLIPRTEAFFIVLTGEGKPDAPAQPAPSVPAESAGRAAAEPGGDGAMQFEIWFEDDCGMESLRAFILVTTLNASCNVISYDPPDIESNSETSQFIMENGFVVNLESDLTSTQVREIIESTPYVKTVALVGGEDSPGETAAETEPAAGDISGQKFDVLVRFEDDCGMENLRAFMLVNSLRSSCKIASYLPPDIENNPATADIIKRDGLAISLETPMPTSELQSTIESAMYVKSAALTEIETAPAKPEPPAPTAESAPAAVDTAPAPDQDKAAAVKAPPKPAVAAKAPIKQSLISVSLDKLDKLMDLMGELVITESMVVRSPDLKGLTKMDNFQKAERQLRKLTDELQDMVMSIRMIPIAGTFQKHQRTVRDMCKALSKECELVTMGEETDIDKTIIDGISDPIMHLVRNAMDHGIETPDVRTAAGKPAKGTITLSAQNTGGEILITISDDGKGLDADFLLEKAKKNGILTKPASEYSEKEAFMLLCAPGFSTKEVVTEFSGRGVGMDVVKKNIEKVGGTVTIESKKGYGSSVFLKIPLTLAIVDGMDISVGNGNYTLQITAINESFKATKDQVIVDTDGNEMIVIRGDVYPIVRLHNLYGVPDCITDIEEGIMIWVQSAGASAVLFADKLIGEQQIVVKPLPAYLSRFDIKPYGISGCTILGDGTISLILDVGSIIDMVTEKR